MGEVTFSIDGGKTYKKPSLLTYEITNPDGSKEKRTASPEQYTNIRWQIPQVAAGAKGEAEFSGQGSSRRINNQSPTHKSNATRKGE